MKTVVEHLTDLIRIPSVSRLSNRPMVEYAEHALHLAGWQTKQQKYRNLHGVEKINLIAAPAGQSIDDVDVSLAFLCHTDTVPFASDWPSAVNPVVSDGFVYGCGSCDVKGFLACLLTAIAAQVHSDFMPGLRLVLTADEEVGCLGASRLLAEGLLKPAQAVIGEPTSLRPARAGKGYFLAEVTITGREAHSAHPEQGRSAIYVAARMISMIENYAAQLAEEKNDLFRPAFTTLNVGTIEGGTAKNIVPAHCRFQIEWRPLPGSAATDVWSAIQSFATEMAGSDPDVDVKLNLLRTQTGFETSANAAVVQSLERLASRPATSIPFGSEASLLAPIAQEVVVFGPGDMRTAHSNRECVPISELEEAVVILGALMRNGGTPVG
jgi:acetylornithine deacetylase